MKLKMNSESEDGQWTWWWKGKGKERNSGLEAELKSENNVISKLKLYQRPRYELLREVEFLLRALFDFFFPPRDPLFLFDVRFFICAVSDWTSWRSLTGSVIQLSIVEWNLCYNRAEINHSLGVHFLIMLNKIYANPSLHVISLIHCSQYSSKLRSVVFMITFLDLFQSFDLTNSPLWRDGLGLVPTNAVGVDGVGRQ